MRSCVIGNGVRDFLRFFRLFRTRYVRMGKPVGERTYLPSGTSLQITYLEQTFYLNALPLLPEGGPMPARVMYRHCEISERSETRGQAA